MKALFILNLCCLCTLCFPLNAQKPVVAAVVWDDRAKEGEDLGELRVYQLGEPVEGLEDVTVRILEDDAYEIDPDHRQAAVYIQDGDIPDVESQEVARIKLSLSRTWEKDI